jgi:asparagine synthase (glutamine-hydrolysing)
LKHSAYLSAFFGTGLTQKDRFDYSHRLRWDTTSRAKRFFSRELQYSLNDCRPEQVAFPDDFVQWDSLSRAQYLEINTFLSQYLLSSQGDRMLMAHSVEGRYPFLDHHVVDFCNRLPSSLKLYGLTEKYLLRKLAREWLPEAIWRRPKQPYRAPIHRSFFHSSMPDYVRELLSPEAINAVGLFDASVVCQLVKKIEQGLPIGESDAMALAGILSTQLIHHQFVDQFPRPVGLCADAKVCIGQQLRSVV